MKKLGGLFLGILLLIPSLSLAQTATSTADYKSQLIAALYAELQVLTQEIQQILSQQAQEASTTQQILSTQQTQSQQIQQIAQNSASLLGGTESTQPSQPAVPSCTPNPTLWVSTSTNFSPMIAGEINMTMPEEFSFTYQTGCPIDSSTPWSWGLYDQNGVGWAYGVSYPYIQAGPVTPWPSVNHNDDYFDLSRMLDGGHGSGIMDIILKVTVGGNTVSALLDSTSTVQ